MKKVAIIGGGIVGLSAAYFLHRAGCKVTVFDKDDMQNGCSYGNAGMVVPSHIVPLAAPGMISKGIRWMFDSKSPFYIKPRLDGDLLRWGYRFYKSATRENVMKGAVALKDLSLFSQSKYEELKRVLPVDFDYHHRGLLMLYQKQETGHEEEETAGLANQLGIKAEILSPDEVQKLEPDVKVNCKGAIYFPGDTHLTPQDFMQGLKMLLKSQDVEFRTNEAVNHFDVESRTVKSMRTIQGESSFDEYVLAAGSWSGSVAKSLGLTLPMQAGKGYSITKRTGHSLRVPSILLEARVAVTPMGETIRFGGTMEIAGIDHSVNMNRMKGIVEAIPKYYPEMKIEMPKEEEVWHGLRPCSPDGLPYIGRSGKLKNVIVATGHAMMGVSLAPGTGELVAQLVMESEPAVSISAFNPDRF